MPARSLPPGKKVRAWRKEGFDDFAPTAVDAARQNIKVAEPEAEAGAFAALATFNCGKRAECDGLAKAQALLHSVIAMRQTPIDFELAAPYVDGGGLACSTHISGSNA